MKKYLGLQTIAGAVFLITVSVPARAGVESQQWQDEETYFLRTVSTICSTCGEVLGNLAAAYTTKCGLAPSIAQMKLIMEDPAYFKAIAMFVASNDQMRDEGAIATNPPLSFTAYMQTIAVVICR